MPLFQRTVTSKSRFMPATRSSARRAAQATAASATEITHGGPEAKTPSRKRKPENTLTKENVKKMATPDILPKTTVQEVNAQASSSQITDTNEELSLIPAVLAFDYEEAKKHLKGVDHRFEDLFVKMKCKPFERLEQVHPFRYEGTTYLMVYRTNSSNRLL